MLDAPQESANLQEFVRLLTESQTAIRGFIVSLMPGNPDTGDVLQETNIALWKKRSQFEMGSNFTAWAFTFARFEVLRYSAQRKRADRVKFSPEVIDTLSDTIRGTERNELYLQALERCVGGLQPKQRALVEYRYTEGKSLEKFSEMSGTSPGSLRIALMRVRKVLKRCIEAGMREGDDG